MKKIATGYMVYHQSRDSLHSLPLLPIAVFFTEENAIAFAKEQTGYGYNKDWFVKPIPVHA